MIVKYFLNWEGFTANISDPYHLGYGMPLMTPVTFWLPQRRRNMSRDLRGGIPIPMTVVSPWYQPSVGPIYNRQMIMQSIN